MLKDQPPVRVVLLQQDLLHLYVCLRELFYHDRLCRLADVVRRIHARVGGGDYGEEVLTVPDVLPRVPDHEPERRVLLERFEHHGRWPHPLRVHLEEPGQEDAGAGVGVQLADAGDKDGPVDAPKEAEHVGVDPPPLRPQLHGPQGGPEIEYLLLRDELEDDVRDAAAVEAPNAHVVAVPECADMADIKVVRNDRGIEAGIEEIDLNARELHLDDWHIRIIDRRELRHRRVLPEHLLQAMCLVTKEIVLASRVPWPDTKGINVGSWPVDSKPIGAKREDPRIAYCLLTKPIPVCHPLDPLLHKPVQRAKYFFPAETFLLTLVKSLLPEIVFKTL
mmetsp:Transcript_28340/g.67420  ORF Transcript_28340/g.67420 Transcript_28340/m.67420 type:complete len:334 (-) Transcript_28340:356-1357(-)